MNSATRLMLSTLLLAAGGAVIGPPAVADDRHRGQHDAPVASATLAQAPVHRMSAAAPMP